MTWDCLLEEVLDKGEWIIFGKLLPEKSLNIDFEFLVVGNVISSLFYEDLSLF